jgi:hypothetical protein
MRRREFISAMSALPPKATSMSAIVMSGKCQKQTSAYLLNHLISASKQCRRHIKVGPRLSFLRPRGRWSSSLRRLKPMARMVNCPAESVKRNEP